MNSIFFKLFAISASALAVSLALCFIIMAWSEPSSTPPDGNIAAPLNTGAILQNKIGDLLIGAGLKISSLGTAFALKTNDAQETARVVVGQDGNVGIGTTEPGKKLEVAGDTKSTQFCLGDQCCSSWANCAAFAGIGSSLVDANTTAVAGYTKYTYTFFPGNVTYYWCPPNYCIYGEQTGAPFFCAQNGYVLHLSVGIYGSRPLIALTNIEGMAFGTYASGNKFVCRNGNWFVADGENCYVGEVDGNYDSGGILECDRGTCDAGNRGNNNNGGKCVYKICNSDSECPLNNYCSAGICCFKVDMGFANIWNTFEINVNGRCTRTGLPCAPLGASNGCSICKPNGTEIPGQDGLVDDSSKCLAGQICHSGNCCSDQCSQAGHKKCVNSTTVADCVMDADHCLKLANSRPCNYCSATYGHNGMPDNCQ